MTAVVPTDRRRSTKSAAGRKESGRVSVITQAHEQLTAMSTAIAQYRQTLSKTQLEEFDGLWGLNEEGRFISGEETAALSLWSKLTCKAHKTKTNVSQAVYSDLKTVQEQYEQELAFFQSPAVSNREKRNRLMFLFQCDLLPGINGKILENKGARDFFKAKKVSLWSKIAAWTFVALLNAGMLFYVLLFALNQTTPRQNAWFNSFVVWLIVEILLVSTAMALLTHVVIPSVVMRDVTKIKQKLLDSIREYHIAARSKQDGTEVQSVVAKDTEFNAAQYLFVSHRIAVDCPEVKECGIVAQFSTPWPRQSYQHVKDVSKGYNRSFSALTKSASIILLFFVTNALNIPATAQDMVIHMVTTSTVGYTMLLHIQLFGIFPLLAFGPFIVMCLLVHFVVQSGRANARLRLAKLMPTNEQKDAAKKQSHHRSRRQSVQSGINVLRQINNNVNDGGDNDDDDDESSWNVSMSSDLLRHEQEGGGGGDEEGKSQLEAVLTNMAFRNGLHDESSMSDFDLSESDDDAGAEEDIRPASKSEDPYAYSTKLSGGKLNDRLLNMDIRDRQRELDESYATAYHQPKRTKHDAANEDDCAERDDSSGEYDNYNEN